MLLQDAIKDKQTKILKNSNKQRKMLLKEGSSERERMMMEVTSFAFSSSISSNTNLTLVFNDGKEVPPC